MSRPTFEPLFITALIILDDEAARALSECSRLTTTQYRILLKTHELGEPSILGEVATSLGINSNTASRAVSQMVEWGYMEKAFSLEDSRKVLIQETEQGTQELEKVDAHLSTRMAREFSTISDDQRTAIYSVIETLGYAVEHSSTPKVEMAIPSSFLSTSAMLRADLTSAVRTVGGLSLTDFRVLQMASLLGESAQVSKVSHELMFPVNTVTWTLGRLERQLLVNRVGDQEDRRVVRIVLTEDGQSTLEKVQGMLDDALEVLYEVIGDWGMELAHTGSDSLIQMKRQELQAAAD